MELVIATSNKHKLIEIKDILSGYFNNIVSVREKGFFEEIEENGLTFFDNALIKALAVSKALNCNALADDSGLCVDALNGRPGVFSARYAGDHGNDKLNNQKILKDMQGVEKRNCRFTSSIALVLKDGRIFKGEGHTEGILLTHEDGKKGFGYDPLFFSTTLNMSFGKATPEQKNSVSHRYNALIDLINNLKANKTYTIEK